MTKHLYVHIPFCSSVCSYCDFARVIYDKSLVDKYILNLEKKFNANYEINKFKTIYIGGGTPNCLNNEQLQKLLSIFKNNLESDYEFTIECNPEKINTDQIKIFKKNKINRISLGVQTTNDILAKQLGRHHTTIDVINAITLLQENGLNNISCDFIYGFNELCLFDIEQSLKLMSLLKINHLSFYSLELKENSYLKKTKYDLAQEQIEKQLEFIISYFEKNKYLRYEVSNWAKNKKSFSQHNLAYWQSKDWAALGYKAYGFENKKYYVNDGSVSKYDKKFVNYNEHDYYFQIISMGLRVAKGIDLKQENNQKAYMYFKDILDNSKLITKNKNNLICNNLNLLDNVLIELI